MAINVRADIEASQKKKKKIDVKADIARTAAPKVTTNKQDKSYTGVDAEINRREASRSARYSMQPEVRAAEIKRAEARGDTKRASELKKATDIEAWANEQVDSNFVRSRAQTVYDNEFNAAKLRGDQSPAVAAEHAAQGYLDLFRNKPQETRNETYAFRQAEKLQEAASVFGSNDFGGMSERGKLIGINLDGNLPKSRFEKIITFVNNDPYRNSIEALAIMNHGDSNLAKQISQLTEDEKKIIRYYAARGEKDKVEEFYKLMERELNARIQTAVNEQTRQEAYDKPVLGAVKNVAGTMAAPAGYVANAGNAIANVFRDDYIPTDYNTPAFSGAHMAEQTSAGVTERASDAAGGGVAGEFASLLAGTGLSIANQLVTLPMGAAGSLAYMSAEAAGQTTLDALKRGASAEQALFLSTAAGAIEAMTEKIPLDNLFKVADEVGEKGLKNFIKTVIKEAPKQGITEAGEEIVSEIANTIMDIAVMKDKSGYEQYIAELMQNGMSRAEAEKEALIGYLGKNVLMAGAGGLLSGIVMGSGATTVSHARGAIQSRNAGVAEGEAGFTKNEYSEKVSNKTIRALDAIGKKLGVNITIGAPTGTGQGSFNGYYKNGRIVISQDADDPLKVVLSREVTHHMKDAAPAEYAKFAELAINASTKLEGTAKADLISRYRQSYAEGTQTDFTEDAAIDEITADYASKLVNDVETFRELVRADMTVAERFIESVKDFIAKVKTTFSKDKTKADTASLEKYGATVSELEAAVKTYESIIKTTQAAVASGQFGIENTAETEQGGGVKYSLKRAQPEIIQKNNPAPNTYQTWIRSEGDIRTLEEAVTDSDWDYDEYNPDYTRAMAKDAIEKGEIRVYSSYPIEQGVFVTPSKMETERYSGTGKVYSKVVPISDVAWIDPTQGQYAVVEHTSSAVEGIYPNMPESERTEILGKTNVTIVEYDDTQGDISEETARELEHTYKSRAQQILKSLAEKFGLFKNYKNSQIELEFNYSNRSLSESTHIQNMRNPNFSDFAKMLSVFDDVVANAQPIEAHSDKYIDTVRADEELESVHILLGAFKDGKDIVPVEFNIKEFKTGKANKLYVSVTLKRIEADLMAATAGQNALKNTAKSTSVYSIAEIIKNINPSDGDFLKYIPDSMLSQEQLQAKKEAIERDKEKISELKKKQFSFKKNNAETDAEDEDSYIAETVLADVAAYESILDVARGEDFKTVSQMMKRFKRGSEEWKILKDLKKKGYGKRNAYNLIRELKEEQVDAEESSTFSDSQQISGTTKPLSREETEPVEALIPSNIEEIQIEEPSGEVGKTPVAPGEDGKREATDVEEPPKVEMPEPAPEEIQEATPAEDEESYIRDTGLDAYFEKSYIDETGLVESEDIGSEKVKEKYREKIKGVYKKQRERELRGQILRITKRLDNMLRHPTDSKHVPQEMQKAVSNLLRAINLEGMALEYDTDAKYHRVEAGYPFAEITKRTAAFRELKKIYEKIGGTDSTITISPELLEGDAEGRGKLFEKIIEMQDVPLYAMSEEQLRTVKNALGAVENSVRTANKMFTSKRGKTLEEVAKSIRDGARMKNSRVDIAGMSKLKKLISLDMMTPEEFFHRLGPGGDSVFRMLRDAQDKKTLLLERTKDFSTELLSKKKISKLETTTHKVILGEEELKLSTAQLMELYVLTRREQAIEHIFKGGIIPEALPGTIKVEWDSVIRHITQEEVGRALDLLSPEEKRIAEQLSKFTSSVLGAEMNEACLNVFGYEKFGEENYWPIRTVETSLKTDEKQAGGKKATPSIRNFGMANATTPKAKTPLKIGSIFDTFTSHTAEATTYAAYLEATEDLRRILNYTFFDSEGDISDTMKEVVKKTFGKDGLQYWSNLDENISGGMSGDDGGLFDSFMRGSKAAAVSFNIRVVAQQPTAVLRAGSMIDYNYLLEGMAHSASGWKRAVKYAPIAKWKAFGFFDSNTGPRMKDLLFEQSNALEKTREIGMKGAELADAFGWGTIWSACEAELRAKIKRGKQKASGMLIQPGTEEFYNAVAKRFTEIIDHTQVVDGVLQRSQIMRSSNALNRMATSFMAEPTKVVNMFSSAVRDFATAEKGEARREAGQKLARTSISLLVSFVINAALGQAFIDALRDDDKEKGYWTRWLEHFGDNFIDAVNPLQYFPYVKDVVSIYQGYSVDRMDMNGVENVIEAARNVISSFKKDSSASMIGTINNMCAVVGTLLGVGTASLKRDVRAIVMEAAAMTGSLRLEYLMAKETYAIGSEQNRDIFYDILRRAYEKDKKAYHKIRSDMLKKGFKADEIDKKMKTHVISRRFSDALDKAKEAKEANEATSADKIVYRHLNREKNAIRGTRAADENTILGNLDEYREQVEKYLNEYPGRDEEKREEYAYRKANYATYGAEYAIRVNGGKSVYKKAEEKVKRGKTTWKEYYEEYFGRDERRYELLRDKYDISYSEYEKIAEAMSKNSTEEEEIEALHKLGYKRSTARAIRRNFNKVK